MNQRLYHKEKSPYSQHVSQLNMNEFTPGPLTLLKMTLIYIANKILNIINLSNMSVLTMEQMFLLRQYLCNRRSFPIMVKM